MNVNYQRMYAILCGAISDALDQLPIEEGTAAGRTTLKEAIRQTEELYLDASGGTKEDV